MFWPCSVNIHYLSESPLDICGAKSFCTAGYSARKDKIGVLTASMSCHSWYIGDQICTSAKVAELWQGQSSLCPALGEMGCWFLCWFFFLSEKHVSKQGYSYSFPSWLLLSSTSHPLFLAKDGPELASGVVANSEVFQLGFRSPPHSYESRACSLGETKAQPLSPGRIWCYWLLHSEDHNNVLPKLFWDLTKKFQITCSELVKCSCHFEIPPTVTIFSLPNSQMETQH